MHIRSRHLLAAAAFAFVSGTPALAAPPFAISSLNGFAIKQSDLDPTGCHVVKNYTRDGESATVTCPDEARFQAAFALSDKLQKVCEMKDKYVCEVKE